MTEFNRSESTKTVGELYPVLLSKDGQVIDGFHRLEDNPNWKTETLDHIDSDEKLLLARAISNWHRREIPRKEKEEWINGLALIYQKQGLKISSGPEHKNEISEKIQEVTGLSKETVVSYLDIEFKQIARKPIEEARKPRVPASQRIETNLGLEVVERHEAEVLEKALEDPEFVKKAIQRAPKILERKELETLKPTPIIVSGQACQFIDPEVLKGTGKGKDFSHLALFPQCVCMDCGHFQICRGGELR